MTRLLMVVGAIAMWSGVAGAAPKRKVKIDTEPSGATVYLNAKEDGPMCKTPCTIEVPVGDTPIIVELENHKQLFENLVVPAKKPVSVKFKLVPAIGTINVKGPTGARITVDDEDKGKAPAKFEVGAGAHTVVLTLDGKTIATEFVDVMSNDEVVVEGKASGGGKKPPTPPPPKPDEVAQSDGEGPEDGGSGVEGSTSSGVEAPSKSRGPYISLALAVDIGFRDFTYENPDNLTPEKERGQVMVGPVGDLYLLQLFGLKALPGFFVRGRFGYGVNQQVVKEEGQPTGAKTFWRTFEASARYRHTIKNTATIEAAFGYVRDQYQFSGDRVDIAKVPDADYHSVMAGLRASIVGKVEPYAAFEQRFVIKGGALEERFDKTSITGLRVAAGLIANFGSLKLSAEAALNRYAWTLENTSMMTYDADGGVDSIKLITLSAAYAY